MTVHPTPLADLHTALANLSDELRGASDLEGTSPAYFQSRLLPMLAALGDVTRAASVAFDPALVEETHRANASDICRTYAQAGDA